MWVKIEKYCQDTGDTADSVHAKRKRGIWLDGRECKVAGDGRLWINQEAVQAWVLQSNPEQKTAGASPTPGSK